MVGSNGTLMTMRLVRSKLRKREESSTVSPVTAGNVEAPPHHHHHHHNHHHQHHHPHSHHQLHQNGTSHPQQQQQQNNSSSNHHHQQNGGSSPETGYSVPTPIAFRQSPSTVWVFPPLPPQPNIYNASSQVRKGEQNHPNCILEFRIYTPIELRDTTHTHTTRILLCVSECECVCVDFERTHQSLGRP